MKRIVIYIANHPVYTILLLLGLLAGAFIGVMNVNIKTDNSTYVDVNSKTYNDHYNYVQTFGGETVILQLESYNHPLDINTITLMHEIETNIDNIDGVFSYQSPATIVKNMTSVQYNQFREGINQISIGLDTVATSMETQMSILAGVDIETLEDATVMISDGFDNLDSSQTNLSNGLEGLDLMMGNILLTLDQMSTDLESDGELIYANQIDEIYNNLTMAHQSLVDLKSIPDATINGLSQLDQNIGQLLQNLIQQFNQVNQLSDQMMVLSTNLSDMADTLSMIYDYSDAFYSGMPTSPTTLDHIIYDQGEPRLVFNNFVIDDTYTLMQIILTGDVTKDQKQEIVDTIESTIMNHGYDGEYLLSGKAILDLSIQNSMVDSMQTMLGLSILIMIGILLLTFKVRWRILPLITVLMAVLMTIGLMGHLSIPITMVSMAVFPILIGLGIDYAIQFHHRYHELLEEEAQQNE